MSPPFPDETPVIFFDGVCVLCNGAARFVLRRDRRARFRFALLQSPVAQRTLGRFDSAGPSLESVLLIAGGRVHRKSRAILEIARRLDAPWPLLYALIVFPRPLADAVYDFVGARRYRWFGTTTCCSIAATERERFLHE